MLHLSQSRQLAGVEEPRDAPLSFANSVQRVQLLSALSSGGFVDTAPNMGINAVGEMARVSMADWRPTADPPARTATTYLGGLLSEQSARSDETLFVFARDEHANRFPFHAPSQANAVLRYGQ